MVTVFVKSAFVIFVVVFYLCPQPSGHSWGVGTVGTVGTVGVNLGQSSPLHWHTAYSQVWSENTNIHIHTIKNSHQMIIPAPGWAFRQIQLEGKGCPSRPIGCCCRQSSRHSRPGSQHQRWESRCQSRLWGQHQYCKSCSKSNGPHWEIINFKYA